MRIIEYFSDGGRSVTSFKRYLSVWEAFLEQHRFKKNPIRRRSLKILLCVDDSDEITSNDAESALKKGEEKKVVNEI